MMEPQIRFCTSSDGTRIGYATYGDNPGRPWVWVAGWGYDMEAYWLAEWSRVFAEIAARRGVIQYDRRGTGMSQREVDDLSLDAQVSDLSAVVDTVGLEHFDIYGWSDASAIAISYAARHPDRVSRLVLSNPFPAADEIPLGKTAYQVARMIRTHWSLARRAMATAGFPTGPVELQRWWSQVIKGSMYQEVAARHFEEYIAGLDVTHELPEIQAPTLVLHFSEETGVPQDASRSVVTAIPDARFVPLTGNYAGSQDKFETIVLPFLDEGREEPPPDLPSGLTVILFADIAGSTALTERLGDAAFRERARELDGSLRALIRDSGGTPVEGKLLGDGVLAVFTSARQAIEAALRCRSAGDEYGLPLHLGLHAGDVIREDDGNVFGGAVNIAARIASASAPGEVLVSGTVRDLARTSAGVAFEERGERALKGVSEPVRVWAVRQRERG